MSTSSKSDDDNNPLSSRKETDNSTTSTDKRSLSNQSNSSKKEEPQARKVALHKAKKKADLRLPSTKEMSPELDHKESIEIRNEIEEKVVITPNSEIILNYDYLCAVDSDDEIN